MQQVSVSIIYIYKINLLHNLLQITPLVLGSLGLLHLHGTAVVVEVVAIIPAGVGSGRFFPVEKNILMLVANSSVVFLCATTIIIIIVVVIVLFPGNNVNDTAAAATSWCDR